MSMEVIDRPSLAARTTLRMGGHALAELTIRSDGDWDEAARRLEREGGHPFILGGGSNLLAGEGYLPYVLLRPELSGSIEVISDTDRSLELRMDAGVRLPRLMGWSAKFGLSGLEPLAGIPGTVGGAAAMNAGSFGAEFGQAVRRLQIWTPENGLGWVDREALGFSYRKLLLEQGSRLFAINRLELSLVKEEPDTVRQSLKQYYRRKKQSQPILARTCGCVFKNPTEGLPAGALLDRSGLKGTVLGQVGFSRTHANFLVNLGQGDSRDAFRLIDKARAIVQKRFGVALELEVRTLEDPELSSTNRAAAA